MGVNLDKPQNWKADIAQSVDMYNDWFMRFVPKAFRDTRVSTTRDVEAALHATGHLTDVKPALLRKHPEILPTLRMSTCPPLAVDRLIGLARVSRNLVKCMESEHTFPVRMREQFLDAELAKIGTIIEKMADPDIFVWLGRRSPATTTEMHRAATIVADRLCGSVANPIIRNAQEKRQLAEIKRWLERRGYKQLPVGEAKKFDAMPAGTFSFRMNVPIRLVGGEEALKTLAGVEDDKAVIDEDRKGVKVNIPIDAVIKPRRSKRGGFPIFFEAKSAGDFTNTNKRRKEEAVKMQQLRHTYGKGLSFNLFLCGYFDSGYLGYEAAEGIDWVWEHRIDDLEKFGI